MQAGRLSFEEARDAFISRISLPIYNEVYQFFSNNHSHLWGQVDEADWIEKVFAWSLYKYMYNRGYHSLRRSSDFGLNISHGSYVHNTHVVLRTLKEWALQQITIRPSQEWENHKIFLTREPTLNRVNLLIDSTDFPITKHKGMGKKSSDWSYKCNSPGRRYMVIMDCNYVIQRVWGGYSPKVYDAEFLNIVQPDFDALFHGGVILGDMAFRSANDRLRNCQIVTAIPQPANRANRRTGENVAVFTQEQKKFNQAVHQARARIENPFAQIENIFTTLQHKFNENVDFLDCIVYFGFAVILRRKGLH